VPPESEQAQAEQTQESTDADHVTSKSDSGSTEGALGTSNETESQAGGESSAEEKTEADTDN